MLIEKPTPFVDLLTLLRYFENKVVILEHSRYACCVLSVLCILIWTVVLVNSFSGII